MPPAPMGVLLVVATPIGNLGDISPRAARALADADLVLAEDTRHTARLLAHLGVTTPTQSFHDHNEARRVDAVLARLAAGETVALVSDAGTPLVSDPGYLLVRAAREAGFRVSPLPGPSAILAALSVAGLPSARFVFEGFLPARDGARGSRLAELAREPRTMVFYEAPHRITTTLAAMCEHLGPERPACIARELTKVHETVVTATLGQLAALAAADADMRRGELVVVVGGAPAVEAEVDDRTLSVLLDALPPAEAARVAARLTGAARKAIYRRALELTGRVEGPQES